jgi:GT2 family glycosyltransferase
MPKTPKVAIIILTWNKKDYVLTLLGCIKDLDYKNYDVIVVDNASTDGTVEALRKSLPDVHLNVHLIVNSENLGGTGGFNTGMKYALGKGIYDYLWLLDNDVEVDSHALSTLIDVLESSKEIAITGSAMYDLTDKGSLLELGYFIDLERGRFNNNMPSEPTEKEFIIVDSVSSCSLCVSTEAIADVGIWDESYFIYCDDVDWNIRFGHKGYKTACVPGSKIWHVPWLFKIGFTTAYYSNRNMMYLMSKHLPFPKKISGMIYKELSLIILSLRLLKSGDSFHSIIVLRALTDFFDKKFGKFEDDDYINSLEEMNTGQSYFEWIKMLMKLGVKNLTYTLSVLGSVIRSVTIKFLRGIFRKLPDETRLRIIKRLNDHYLSKRV